MTDTPAQCWVDVQQAGIIVGDGPIMHVISWTSTALLSKAGTFTLTLSAADPRVTLLTLKRTVHCYTIINATRTEVGAGIIDSIEWTADGRRVTVTGPDLLGELRYRSVHDLAIYSETRHAPTRVWWWDGANFNYEGVSDDWYDGDLSSSDEFNLTGSNSFLYIGYSTPFNVLYCYQATANANAKVAGLHYGYSAGGDRWPELKIYSDTQYDPASDTGIPWPAALLNNDPLVDGTGTVLFKRNANWASYTLNGVSAYWLRIDPDADLTAATRIDEFVVGIRTNLAADLAPIMALAPGTWPTTWDDNVGGYVKDRTALGTNAVFAGETVLAALVKLAKNSGESFRLGTGRTLEWLQSDGTVGSFDFAYIRAMRNTGSERQATNLLTCQIVSLTRTNATTDLVTRVYPYGPGNGAARVTLAHATMAMPSGYTLDAAANYIKYTVASPAAGEALYGQIDAVMSFKDIDTRDEITAANNLAQAALSWLQRHVTEQRFYRLEVTGLKAAVKVGTKIHVIYREVFDGRVVEDIDEYLIILGVTRTFAAGQVHTVNLDVGTSDTWPNSDAETLADMIEAGTFYEAYPQDVADEIISSVSGGGGVSIAGGGMVADDSDMVDGKHAIEFVWRAGPVYAVATKSGDYTLQATDGTVVFTATATATLPAATGSGITFRLCCRAGTLTIDANGSETVKGALTQKIYAGDDLLLSDVAAGIWE